MPNEPIDAGGAGMSVKEIESIFDHLQQRKAPYVVRVDWAPDEKMLRCYLNDEFQGESPCETLEEAEQRYKAMGGQYPC